uniref:Mutator-like transposase domain-containing protein n=1 Tax=Homalodisca liturata TaxID=320908 RepID=A0A1B6JCK1_9HEMI
MEVAGALDVFRKSRDRNVRYVRYLGDGDSNGFKKVVDDKPYGDEVEVRKLECVNHVKKRMGSRLRELKKRLGKTKLKDNRAIGGKNRLTNNDIDKLQEYYGLAIKRGGSDLQQMVKNVWATYFHKISNDDTPQHGLCPKGPESWCGYNKAEALHQTFSHKSHNLPYEVMVQIKQIYRDLANPDLLKKCLDQKTQNQNESFNNAVWSKVPKNVFVRLNTLKLGIYDAVLTFNNGFTSKLDVYNKLGIKLSEKSVAALRNFDTIRLKKAEKSALDMTKEARVARRKRKLALEEENEDPDDPEYGAGMF